jgi:putative sigma-54 modulation protein
MRVHIHAENFDLTDKLEAYVDKKLDRLDKYLDILEDATVDLTYAKSARSAADRQVVQLTIRGKGVLLRAEERSDDMMASIDAVVDKIVRQINRYKGKRWDPRGDGKSVADVSAATESAFDVDLEDENPHEIMRRKKFLLAPMDELEAIEQMALLGHENFFVFLNANSGQVNVLYRRRDQSYGLIETEIG